MKTDEIAATPVREGRLHPLSIEAYHVLVEAGVLPRNAELLYGLLYTKMPKSPIHQVLIARLMRAFAKVDQQSLWVRSEGPITCADSEPEPDVSAVRGTEEDYTRGHPHTAEFVGEICVTSHEYDRSKLRAYALGNVKEIWLVLWPEKQVEIYRNPKNGKYTEKSIAGPGGQLTSEAVPGLTIDLDKMFLE